MIFVNVMYVFLVNLRIELDVPIGGFASPSDTGIWLLSDPDPSPDR
jgi:hypothetical protein